MPEKYMNGEKRRLRQSISDSHSPWLMGEGVSPGQSPLTGFLVERRQVMPCLLHHIHHAVERDTVDTVSEGCVEVGVKCTGCSVSVALNTGDLNQSAYRVAGHPKMMLQPHLGS